MDTEQTGSAWDTIQVGEDLGSFTYLITAEMIENYRRVVENPMAAYPTIAGRHPARAMYQAYGEKMRVPNAGQESQYFNPPLAGKWIHVTSQVADKYIRREKRYLVIEARAVDEDGRLIEVSRLIGMAGEGGTAILGEVAKKWES